MQLKSKPIFLVFIIVLGLTAGLIYLIPTLLYTSPSAVYRYQKTHASDIAIACINLADSQNNFFQNKNQPFPLASAIKIVLLTAYATEVSATHLNPNETITISDLDNFYLPGTDGGAHNEFINSLGANRTKLTLDEVVTGMTTYGSNAAADYLLNRLNKYDFNNLYHQLNLKNTNLPISFLGLYLFLNNHETGMYAEEVLSSEEAVEEQARLANLFKTNKKWREDEIKFVTKSTNAPPIEIQKQFLYTFGINGSVDDISKIFIEVYGDSKLFSNQTQSEIRSHLEWPLSINTNQTKEFTTLASVSGAWPSIFTSAWYSKSKISKPIILVVLYRNIPDVFWNTWLTTFSHQQFETNVLSSANCSLFPQQK